MANYTTLVLSVDELWLKGANRKFYFKSFRDHAKEIIKYYHPHPFQMKNESQKLVVDSQESFSKECIDALINIPGLHALRPSITIDSEYEKIFPAIIGLFKELENFPKTFKVQCKRNDKTFPHNSMDINREIGHLLPKEFSGLKVDVHNPEVMIEIKIHRERTFISVQTLKGIGGLPVGMTGHVMTLLSGGFDSPVASYLMARRGCSQDFVFFYAYPFVGDEVKEKIVDLVKILKKYQKRCRLFIVPFGDIQNKISKTCSEEYRTLLFRKYMIECASKIARIYKAKALVTGDSLGQVSSQTLENISALDSSSDLSILRPLLGMNKVEIISLSREIKTHEVSVIPHDDACSLFAPKHPIIRPNLKYWMGYLKDNDFTQEIEKAIEDMEIHAYDLKRPRN